MKESNTRRISSKDSLPRAEVFAPRDEQESMLMYGKPGLEFEATDAAPGSIEKVAVLAWRAECGYPLFHPDDRVTYDGIDNYKEPVDPWGFTEMEFDDEGYELESQLPEHLR